MEAVNRLMQKILIQIYETFRRLQKILYIATMQVYDAEGREKVFRHRKMREGKGFLTIEQSTDIQQAAHKMEKKTAIENAGLLECMSNLVANEMFREDEIRDGKLVQKSIIGGIKEVLKTVKDFIIVTNNVFEDGIIYDETTMNYIRTMGCINEELAKMADRVIEVVVGIPIIVKRKISLTAYFSHSCLCRSVTNGSLPPALRNGDSYADCKSNDNRIFNVFQNSYATV